MHDFIHNVVTGGARVFITRGQRALWWRRAFILLAVLTAFGSGWAQTSSARQIIRVVMDDNYPPFVFKDSNGKLQGIIVDQWRLWEQKTGIKAEIHAMDWDEALRRMRAGEFDVIDTIFKTEERKNHFDFTRSYASINVPIFFRKGISGIKDLASLKGFSVAAKDGDAAADLLKANGIQPLLLFNNYEAIINAAKEDKVSVFVVDEPPALYFLNKLGIEKAFRMTMPISVGAFHRAVRKGNTNLLQQIERGFDAVGQSALAQVNEKWRGRAIPGAGSSCLGYAKGITLVLVLVAALLAAWNWTLSGQVRRRTLTLQENEARLRISEERFRLFMDNSPTIAWVKDEQGRHVYLSKTFEKRFGVRLEDWRGKTDAELWPPEIAEQFRKNDLAVLAAGTSLEIIEETKNADGSPRFWLNSKFPFRDADGNRFVAGIGLNITDRLRERNALREREEQLQLFVQHSPAAIAMFDHDMRYLITSNRWLTDYGLEGQELFGRSHYEVFPAISQRWKEIHQRCLAGAVERCEEDTFTHADGRTGWIRWEIRPWQQGDGAIGGIIIFSEDITERKQTDERLQHLNRVYAVLSDINQTIVREQDSQTMLDAACEIAVHKGKFQMAWIGRIQPANDRIEIAAHAGATDDTLRILRSLVCGSQPDCHFTHTALHSRQHSVCNDIANDPATAAWRSEALQRNYHSMVSLPLLAGGKVAGTFNLYAAEPGFFDEDEMRLLDELATDISFALEIGRRQREQRAAERRNTRQRNELIALTSQLRQPGDSLEMELQQIAEAAARTVDVARVGIWRYNEDRSVLICADLFERDTGQHSSGTSLEAATHPTFFRALLESDVIGADDAMTDAFTREFAEDYFRPLGITSKLSVPINAGGRPVGVLCHEHIGKKRNWTADEKTFAVAMANLVSLAIEGDERRQAESALRSSEESFRELAETIQEVFWIAQPDHLQVLYVSPAYEKIWGRSIASLYENPHSWLEAIHPADRKNVIEATNTKQIQGKYDEEYRVIRPDGTERWIRDRAFPVRNAAGQVERIIGVARDITPRRVAEDNLRQSQKMEAIGQLAGGVAHDFNNILAAIIMHVDLITMYEQLSPDTLEGMQQIKLAAERAASLTRQLLLFSRKQVMQPGALNLNEIVTALAKMLQRIIGEDVQLRLHLHASPLMVYADAGMLDQVLMNLAVNSRDAMPIGGHLVIETSLVSVDETLAGSNPDAEPGLYVCLSVSDTGGGISSEILPHIFEPFFTTKEAGKGTGLGLATVFGIVKQHRGWIKVCSEPGKGAKFNVYLPAHKSIMTDMTVETAPAKPRGGTETILFVEDEQNVRVLSKIILQRNGYRVLDAADGVQALQVWEKNRDDVALLFTDLVMPGGINGRELAQQLQADKPGLKVIFTSGYSADIAGRELELHAGENFVQKPFSPIQLLELVRRSLDG